MKAEYNAECLNHFLLLLFRLPGESLLWITRDILIVEVKLKLILHLRSHLHYSNRSSLSLSVCSWLQDCFSHPSAAYPLSAGAKERLQNFWKKLSFSWSWKLFNYIKIHPREGQCLRSTCVSALLTRERFRYALEGSVDLQAEFVKLSLCCITVLKIHPNGRPSFIYPAWLQIFSAELREYFTVPDLLKAYVRRNNAM